MVNRQRLAPAVSTAHYDGRAQRRARIGAGGMAAQASNFNCLETYEARLVGLGAMAERYFKADPTTCLIKLRQFVDLFAQPPAARMRLFSPPDEPLTELLQRWKAERTIPREASDLFHQLRIFGNQVAHAHKDDHGGSTVGLKVARLRLPGREKLELIRLVGQSHLPARRTLEMLGIRPSIADLPDTTISSDLKTLSSFRCGV